MSRHGSAAALFDVDGALVDTNLLGEGRDLLGEDRDRDRTGALSDARNALYAAHWPSPRPLPGANPAAAGLRRTRLERRPGRLGPGVGVMPGVVSGAEPLDAGGEEVHQDTAELAEWLDHSLLGSPGGEEGHGLAQRKRTGA
jgi:hypothetical protein